MYTVLPSSHCIQEILESVAYCQANGIIHRDLKVRMERSCTHHCSFVVYVCTFCWVVYTVVPLLL